MSDSKTSGESQQGKLGGYSEVKDATKEIQQLCDKVKPQVEKKIGKNFDVYEATKYRDQVVSGMNYIVKVHVGKEEFVHLIIYEQLQCNGGAVELKDVKTGETRTSSL